MKGSGTGGGTALAVSLAAAALIAVLLPGCSGGSGTVEGKATVGGTGVRGAEVQFFVKSGEERSGTPFAAGSAGEEGAFRVDLPPGTYHVVARATRTEGGRERTYKGESPANPVTVRRGRTAAGILVPMAEMSSGGFVPQEGTGVTGTVLSGGRPVRDAHVYAYPEESGTVRGPSYVAFARTDDAGRFRLPLRRGSFLLVARRKGGGDETGSMGKEGSSDGGEGRPVSIAAGEMKDAGPFTLRPPREESRRLRADAGGQEASVSEIRGVVVRGDGAAARGIYVMAYADHRMIGRPFAISGRTRADGAFLLRLPRPGTYHLGARGEKGGPVSPGEWTGTYDGSPDHGVPVGAGEKKEGIVIEVAEKW